MALRREVVDIGFGAAILEPNFAPDTPDEHGIIVLTILVPATDTATANCLSLWHHDGLIALRDALTRAIDAREEDLDQARREAQSGQAADSEQSDEQERNEGETRRDMFSGLTRL